jgi:hypothetical protein
MPQELEAKVRRELERLVEDASSEKTSLSILQAVDRTTGCGVTQAKRVMFRMLNDGALKMNREFYLVSGKG